MSLLMAAHRKIKYLKRKSKRHGQAKRDLTIARAALKEISKYNDEFSQGAMDDFLGCRMIADSALINMKGK
jgi:hypothetical protein